MKNLTNLFDTVRKVHHFILLVNWCKLSSVSCERCHGPFVVMRINSSMNILLYVYYLERMCLRLSCMLLLPFPHGSSLKISARELLSARVLYTASSYFADIVVMSLDALLHIRQNIWSYRWAIHVLHINPGRWGEKFCYTYRHGNSRTRGDYVIIFLRRLWLFVSSESLDSIWQ